jgi:sec-independent protein translocase protein TatB
MFDIGALELVLIGVVTLLVVGPERLPKVARTAGLWLGRGRRAFLAVKEEIDREIKADELKEILRKQAKSNPLESIIEDNGALRPRAKAASSGKADGNAAGKPRAGAASAQSTQTVEATKPARSGDHEA